MRIYLKICYPLCVYFYTPIFSVNHQQTPNCDMFQKKKFQMFNKEGVLLFKSPPEIPGSDAYQQHLDSLGFKTEIVPVIEFVFINQDLLLNKISSHDEYSSIVFTSKRAVESVKRVVDDDKVGIRDMLFLKIVTLRLKFFLIIFFHIIAYLLFLSVYFELSFKYFVI